MKPPMPYFGAKQRIVEYDWDCDGGVVVAPTAPHPPLCFEGGAA